MQLSATVLEACFEHPVSENCSVRVCDADGVSVDDKFEIEDGVLYDLFPPLEDPVIVPFDVGVQTLSFEELTGADQEAASGMIIPFTDESPYLSAEAALAQIFDNAGVPRLGGASGERGWSSVSTFQKCRYLWKQRYIVSKRGLIDKVPKHPPLEIGTIIHAFLSVHYALMIDSAYPLMPQFMYDEMSRLLVTPEHLVEGWRVFQAYLFYWRKDIWEPKAIEHLMVDPKTGQSCRADLLMYLPKPMPGLPVGTYIWDHKSAARFDKATLDGWKNDGEIIGLQDIYERIKMEKRFGPLQGLVVNILGKQKAPNFHRAYVNPSRGLVRDHRKTLKIFSAEIETAVATGSFPRSRAACIGRHGFLCDEYDACTLSQMDAAAEPEETAS